MRMPDKTNLLIHLFKKEFEIGIAYLEKISCDGVRGAAVNEKATLKDE